MRSRAALSRRELPARRAHSLDPAFGAGFTSGLGLGVGRETPMLSKTNPKPFFNVSSRLTLSLPFRWYGTPGCRMFVLSHPFAQESGEWMGHGEVSLQAAGNSGLRGRWSNGDRRGRLLAAYEGKRRGRQWLIGVGQQQAHLPYLRVGKRGLE